MAALNWEIISSNLEEAKTELSRLIGATRARGKSRLNEADLEIGIEHALHHIYFAWNVRRVSTKRYTSMDDADFRRWSKPPKPQE